MKKLQGGKWQGGLFGPPILNRVNVFMLKKKFHAHVSKHNLNREKQVNFLMIPNGQGREAEAKDKYGIILQYSSIKRNNIKK